MNLESFQILVFLIILLSAFTRSTFGFGDALVSMPLLSLCVGLHVATPLTALMAITISTTILITEWRSVQLKSSAILILTMLIGIPFGLMLLKSVDEAILKTVLAVLLILFSLNRIYNPGLIKLNNDKFAPLFGFFAGIFGGALNTNGPLLAVYGTLRRWDPGTFRATMQGLLFPAGLMIAVGHGIGGLWTHEIWINYLWSLPAIFAGVYFGGRLNRRIPAGEFEKYIYMFLILLGIILLFETFY